MIIKVLFKENLIFYKTKNPILSDGVFYFDYTDFIA